MHRLRGSGPAIAAFLAGALVATLVAAVLADRGEDRPSAVAPATSPSPSPTSVRLARVGGLPVAIPNRTIDDPSLMPYPFMSPTPPPVPTVLDGTYLRTVTLREVGGARIGLPYRCFRCPPFRVDAGVSTFVFFRGAYYLHHHLSGFRTLGSFVVEGDRVTFFNDANCPQSPGVYEFEITAHGLRLRVVEDDCPFSGERALDLEAKTWTRVSACVRRIRELWPGEVAC